MVGPTIHLISGTHHSCERREHTFMILREYTIISCEEKRFWNRTWKMNVPPKVRNFVWRACTDILPTRANLYRRKVPIDPHCSICGQTDETVGHALWECPMARNVSAMAQGRLQKCGIVAQNFFHLV